jgi:Rrf2 family protein
MILTAQEEFGLRCALSLSREQLHPGAGERGALTLGQIAGREGLTPPYAGKILRVLVQAGLVESTRGRSGGYRLKRAASCITVAEVLQALGGKVYDGEICQKIPGDVGLCVHNTDCSVRSLLSGLQSIIDEYLSRTTLADLVTNERQMERVVAFVQREMRESPAGSQAS